MPSPLDSSFTSRITRKRRKKVMEMRDESSELWQGRRGGHEVGDGTLIPQPPTVTSPAAYLTDVTPVLVRVEADRWTGGTWR